MALTKATQNVIVPEIVTTNTTQTITGTKTFTSTIVGNTDTSTKLLTARTINGIAFDGTANITIPASGSTSVKAWVNFDGDTAGTWAGGASTVTRINASTIATVTTTNAHGLTTGNSVYVLTGVVAGAYTVTVLTANTFTITTAAFSALPAVAITFQVSLIRAQYNVSSVTFNQTGVYTVNFTTPMVDANYCPLMLIGDRVDGNGLIAKVALTTYYGVPLRKTIYAVCVAANGSSNLNSSENNVVIFGN